MDQTLKIVVTAAVLLMAAVILFFLIQENTGKVGKNTDEQISQAECEAGKLEYQAACDCSQATCSNSVPGGETDEASAIKNDPEYSSCDWTSGGNSYACGNDYCC